MKLVDLMQAIKENNVPSFSVWYGEEQKILDIYLQQVASLGYKLEKRDTVAGVLAVINKRSLDNSKKVYVVTEDTDFQKQENKWEEIKQRVAQSKHILIVRYNNLNKKLKFYTRNKDACVEFQKLSEEVLTGYIQKDLAGLNDENAFKLCQLCENDYGRILLEINKIKIYCEAINADNEDKVFEQILAQGLIYSLVGDITFKLTDAILYGDEKHTPIYLEQAKRKGEPALRIISILYQGFRNMLAYQGLGNNKSNAAERTGLTSGQLWGVKKNIGGYSTKELLRNTLLCQEVEAAVKTGNIPEQQALDYLVIKCFEKN